MIRPTWAGVGLMVASIGLFVLGRLLGLVEFYILGAMVALALGIAFVVVLATRLDFAVSRVATPARVRVDTPARIDLTIANQRKRRTPVVTAHDHLQGGLGASVLIGSMRGKSQVSLAYQLPTAQRGPVTAGPLELTVSDPLGLFQTRVTAAEELRILVLPKLLQFAALSARSGRDPTADLMTKKSFASSGDEFFGLRPYVIGDELRRVNWRASARSDDLVVRQEEQPKTGRVTLVLDQSAEAYVNGEANFDPAQDSRRSSTIRTSMGFERAVTATASILYAAFAGGDSTRFASTGTQGHTDVRYRSQLNELEERLAVVQPDSGSPLETTIREVTKAGNGGTLVVVTGTLNQRAIDALANARHSNRTVISISCTDDSVSLDLTNGAGRHLDPAVVYHTDDQLINDLNRVFQSNGAKPMRGPSSGLSSDSIAR